MPRLPVLSSQDTVRNFERFGWNVTRQRRSHIVMIKPGEMATLSVPNHPTVTKGTLRSIGPDCIRILRCPLVPS